MESITNRWRKIFERKEDHCSACVALLFEQANCAVNPPLLAWVPILAATINRPCAPLIAPFPETRIFPVHGHYILLLLQKLHDLLPTRANRAQREVALGFCLRPLSW